MNHYSNTCIIRPLNTRTLDLPSVIRKLKHDVSSTNNSNNILSFPLNIVCAKFHPASRTSLFYQEGSLKNVTLGIICSKAAVGTSITVPHFCTLLHTNRPARSQDSIQAAPAFLRSLTSVFKRSEKQFRYAVPALRQTFPRKWQKNWKYARLTPPPTYSPPTMITSRLTSGYVEDDATPVCYLLGKTCPMFSPFIYLRNFVAPMKINEYS